MSADSNTEMDEEQLQLLYSWIDEIPLSRPKKNITRDFSDGVLVAEVVHHFVPKIVELHNYQSASAAAKKKENWKLLNRKVLGKLNYTVSENLVNGVVACKPGHIEVVLSNIKNKIDSYVAKKKAAGLRDNNVMYDYSNGEDNYNPYLEGQPYPQPPPGIDFYGQPMNGVYVQPHGYGGYPNIQNNYPPQGMQMPSPQQYQYQSEPRQASDLRHTGQAPGPPGKMPPNMISPRINMQGGNKSKAKEKSNLTRAQSLQDLSDPAALRLALEEKKQALLVSQETIQILQAKVRRLEHLIHLKDLRISDLNGKIQNSGSGPHGSQGVPLTVPLNQHQPLPGIQRHYDGTIR